MTAGLLPLWSVLSKLDLNISNQNILHFFGVYLYKYPRYKALKSLFCSSAVVVLLRSLAVFKPDVLIQL